jgi:hypothetical protein
MPNANPNIVKSIPPVLSHFHAIKSKPSKMNDGIRWIRKAIMFCHMLRSDEKESNANKLIKRIARITEILGVQ